MPDQSAQHMARELESLLDATETFLRVMASTHLPYDSVLRIERAAFGTARELLADLDASLGSIEPGTDEVLAGSTSSTDEAAGRALHTQRVYEPLVADDEPTVHLEIPAHDQVYGEELATEEATSSSAEPSWVSFDEPEQAEEEEIYIAVDEPEPAPLSAGPDTPSYVAFEDSDADGYDEEGETQILTMDPLGGPPKPIDYGDMDADTLISDDSVELEQISEGELDQLSEEALEPLPEPELEEIDVEPLDADKGAARAGGDIETFDLIPELTDEDLALEEVDEPDEDTSLHSIEELRRVVEEEYAKDRAAKTGKASATTSASAGAQVSTAATNKLYSGPRASVPTIRDGGAPRPRAAAVQVNASSGTGQVMGLEEEAEPIEIGSAEDYGEELDFDEDAGGFRLEVQEYEDDLEPYEDEAEDEEVVQPAAPQPPPEPVGPSAAEIAAMFARAREAAESGDMQRGADLFSDVIDADPENIDAYVGRGRLYLDLGDYSRAMSDFMVAEDMAPSNPEPQIAIGDLYFARKDYRKAIDYFNAALGVDPNHAMAFCRRGISHYYRKNYKDSLSDLQKAEQLDAEIPNIGTYITMARKKARK